MSWGGGGRGSGGGGRDDSGGGRGGGPGGQRKERAFTPKGQMSGSNDCAPISSLQKPIKDMFDPIPPIKHFPPEKRAPPRQYTGLAAFLASQPNLFETTPPPAREPFISPKECKEQLKQRRKEEHQRQNDILAADWDPQNNPKATSNAYSTLFVGRLSYETTDKKLKREFEQIGPIKNICLVQDLEGRSRGYAFVEFEREDDVTVALRRMEGKKIDGRRVILDVERGRTVRSWRPARLGGGLGGRKDKKSKKQQEEERSAAAAAAAFAMAGVSAAGTFGRGDGGQGGGYRDRDRDGGDRDRDRDSYRDRGRDRDRERDRDRDRDRERDRSRDRDRDRDRERDRDRDRDRDRERERDRDRDRSRDRGDRQWDRDRGNRGGYGGGGGGGGGSYYGGGGRDRDRSNSRDRRY